MMVESTIITWIVGTGVAVITGALAAAWSVRDRLDANNRASEARAVLTHARIDSGLDKIRENYVSLDTHGAATDALVRVTDELSQQINTVSERLDNHINAARYSKP